MNAVASGEPGAHADLRDLFTLLLDRAVHPRTGLPLTRARIAQDAGISSGYLSDVLGGKRSPRPETARRLALAMRADETQARRAYDLADSVHAAARRARIAQRIHDLRVHAGLTQRQLADLVGTSASVICQLEDDDYEGHSLGMLKRIAAALGCEVDVQITPKDPNEDLQAA